MTSTRRLYLLRHAQAAAAAVGGSDRERPLDDQGEADARDLGRRMAAAGLAPELILCSSAARTRGTLAALEPAVREAQIRFEDALYDGGETAYREALFERADGNVLVIGHNPTIGALARALAASGDRSALERLALGFPTCALAILRVDDPSDPGSARLEALWTPPHRLS